MALSEEQIQEIQSLYSTGNYSNRKIAELLGVGNKVIGTTIKKYNFQKDTIDTLVNMEIANTITANEIKTQKDTLTKTQRTHYDEKFLDIALELNLFNKDTIKNQTLIRKAQDQIEHYIITEEAQAIKDGKVSYAAIEQMPNIIAASKGSDINRKQLYGTTQPREEVKPNDKIIFNMDFGSGKD